MNNRSLIITSIVLLIITIILLTVFLIFAVSGKGFVFNNHNFGKRIENVLHDETYEKDLVKKVEISSTAGDVSIVESTDNNVRVIVKGQNPDYVKVNLENDKLKIDILEEPHKFINFGFYMYDMIVYIPKDYSDEISIDVDYGDIKVGNFENATLNVIEDFGDIQIEKAKNITLKSSYGDVKIGTILNKCDIDLSCGDIKIQDMQIKANSTIESNLGDVKIANIEDVYVDAEVSLGDIKINENNRHSEIILKIKNDCGDVKVNY